MSLLHSERRVNLMKTTKIKNRKVITLAMLISVLALFTSCSQGDIIYTPTSLVVEATIPTRENFEIFGEYVVTIEAQNSAPVVPYVGGKVTDVAVALGDWVEEDSVLFYVDDENAIEQCETVDKAVARANEAHEFLIDSISVRAPVSGYIRSIDIEAMSQVAPSSQLAFISNDGVMEIVIPFLYEEITTATIGSEAVVTLTDTNEVIYGTVTEISGAPRMLFGSIPVNDVTIEVQNPGTLESGRVAVASIGMLSCADTGIFMSESNSPVISGLAGTIDEIFVQKGDYVNVGDTLFYVTNAGTDSQISSAINMISDAIEQQENAYEYLGDHAVKAPISGTVSMLNVKENDMFAPNSFAAQISSNEETVLTFTVSEEVKNHLEIGENIKLTANSNEYKGEISELATVADPMTGLFTVKGVVDGGGELVVGTRAKVELAIFKEENALTIPYSAVHFDGGEAFVYVYEEGGTDDVAIKTNIGISRFDDSRIIVTEGIDITTPIITTWATQLRDGVAVTLEGENGTD